MSYKVDLQSIADELDFDLEDIEMLLEVFLESAKESLEILKEAVQSDDKESIFTSAHAIKGSASNILLDKISDIAKYMESNARESNDIDYKTKYEELEYLILNIEV